jgi:hypothetical protein
VGEGSGAKRIAVTPAIHYTPRGKRLWSLCALENYCLIKVERRRETGPVEVTEGFSDGRQTGDESKRGVG